MKKPSSRREKTFKNSPPSYFHPQETGFYYLQSRYYDPSICRFINADGLASTGQGFIGCNMFAYCLNNPVNGADPSGDISLWYYLFVDCEFGYVHRLVQEACLASMPDLRMEVGVARKNGTYGRADLYFDGVIWEIKTTKSKQLALPQALSYVGGKTTDGDYVSGLGSAGAFRGSFIINCLGTSYIVKYCTPIPGVVLYNVKEIKVYHPEPAYSYVPKSERTPTAKPAPAPVPVPFPIFVFPPVWEPSFEGGGAGGPMFGGNSNPLFAMAR